MSILNKLLHPKKKEPTLAEVISNVPTRKDVQKIMENIESTREKERYWNSLSPRQQAMALRIGIERMKRKGENK